MRTVSEREKTRFYKIGKSLRKGGGGSYLGPYEAMLVLQ